MGCILYRKLEMTKMGIARDTQSFAGTLSRRCVIPILPFHKFDMDCQSVLGLQIGNP